MKHRVTADRTLLGQAALLVAAGLLLALLGLDLPHTFAITTSALVLLVLYRRTDPGHDAEHHALPDINRDGARRDLSELTWAMHGSHGRVSERAHQRVRALAATALADEGIDLHSTDPAQVEAAAERLGATVHRQMTADTRPPTINVLRTWVSAVEALAGAPTADDPGVHAVGGVTAART